METLDQMVVELFRGWTDLGYRVAWLALLTLGLGYQGFRTEH